MTITVIGQVVTTKGMVVQVDATGEPNYAALLPAVGYKRRQPLDLPVHLGHDLTWRLGSVEYLERSDRLGLMTVLSIDADVGDLLDKHGPWFLSDGIDCRRIGDTLYRGGAELREVSLVPETGNCGTRPVVWCEGDITRGSTPYGGPPMPLYWRDTWARAAEAMSMRRYRRTDALEIVDLDPVGELGELLGDPVAARAKIRGERVWARALADPSLSSSTSDRPRGSRVRMHGVWLDEAESAKFIDFVESA